MSKVLEQKFELVSVDKLHLADPNPRKGNVPRIAESIKSNGFYKPLIVQRSTGRILVGNHSYIAAINEGLKELPAIWLDCTDAEGDRIMLADNLLSDAAEWDEAALAESIKAILAEGAELPEIGFDQAALDELLATIAEKADPEAGLTEDDAVPDVPDEPVTRPGDLWLLGEHRLLCGDSLDADQVKRLMAGKLANVAITSPPYSSRRKYDESSGFKPIPPDCYVDWYASVASVIASILAPDGSYFLNIKEHADDGERSLYVKDLVLAHKRQWGWRFVDEFCWRNTANGVPGGWPNRFKNAWEPVFHFVRTREIKFRPEAVSHASMDVVIYSPDNPKSPSGSGLLGVGATKLEGLARPSNVIEARAEGGQGGHSAPFPLALPVFFISAFTDRDEIAFDPFLGSGTTLIAAERTNRTCYGVEISPGYCDVIVLRYQNAAGRLATTEDGRTFEQLKAERTGQQTPAPAPKPKPKRKVA